LPFCVVLIGFTPENAQGGNKKAAGISPSGLLAFSDVKSVYVGTPKRPLAGRFVKPLVNFATPACI
jgi:hypothetical protein